jgi:hypothetical protein
MNSQLFVLAVATALLGGCRSGSNSGREASLPDSAQPPVREPVPDSATIRATGTIRAINIEGGCWRFDAQDGGHFEIEKGSAPEGLLVDGKQATLTLRPRPDLMSTCMIGPIAEVVKVES